MKHHFPSSSIIFTIHPLLFVLLFPNRNSVQNYDHEDKRRQTQRRRMDGESLCACGRMRVYNCVAAAYCVHKIKGFVISLCMDHHSLKMVRQTLKSYGQFQKQNIKLHSIPVEPHHSYFTARTAGECIWAYSVSGLTDIAVHTFTLTTHLLDFWGNQQKIGVRESLIELIWLNIARTIGSAVAELLLSSWRCITLRHNCRSLKLHIYCRLQLLLTTTRSEKTETALHRWNTELQGSSSTHPSWSI